MVNQQQRQARPRRQTEFGNNGTAFQPFANPDRGGSQRKRAIGVTQRQPPHRYAPVARDRHDPCGKKQPAPGGRVLGTGCIGAIRPPIPLRSAKGRDAAPGQSPAAPKGRPCLSALLYQPCLPQLLEVSANASVGCPTFVVSSCSVLCGPSSALPRVVFCPRLRHSPAFSYFFPRPTCQSLQRCRRCHSRRAVQPGCATRRRLLPRRQPRSAR